MSACCHNDSTHSVSSTKQSASSTKPITNMRELAFLPRTSNSGFSISWVSPESNWKSNWIQRLRFILTCWLRTILQFVSPKHHYMPFITNMIDTDFKKKNKNKTFFLPIKMKVYITFMFCTNQEKPPGDKHSHRPQDFACEHLFALFYKPSLLLKLTCR